MVQSATVVSSSMVKAETKAIIYNTELAENSSPNKWQ
jgi:hypothetical protein